MSKNWTDAETPWRGGLDPITEPSFPSILGELGDSPVRSVRSSRLNDRRFRDRASRARFEEPKSLYMIYMKFNDTGGLVVRHEWEHDFTDGVEAAERRLLAIIYDPQTTPQGTNFDDIVWKRRYYLTFVMDNADWEFHWGFNGKDDPLRFMKYKSGSSDIHVSKNYSFSDAEKIRGLGSGDAFRMINYFLNENGIELQRRQIDKYCFNIYLRSPFSIPGSKGSHIVLIVDPDGQNQGPRT